MTPPLFPKPKLWPRKTWPDGTDARVCTVDAKDGAYGWFCANAVQHCLVACVTDRHVKDPEVVLHWLGVQPSQNLLRSIEALDSNEGDERDVRLIRSLAAGFGWSVEVDRCEE